ncbi:hypothetical protein HYT53_05075 [Candidatus Woesearchaeota archaeon]|nr:hypothetical protein [Candidatus Woesearchaeota archaeon]
MDKHLSPGAAWALYFLIIIYVITAKYSNMTLFRMDIYYAVLLAVLPLCAAYTYYADRHKRQGLSISSFAFGMLFWIPLLNLIFGLLAVYLGRKSLIGIKKEPSKYGGKWLAVIGIILGSMVYITYLTGIGMCLFGYKEVCRNIGLDFLAR